jgi:hypothetical protein
VTSADDIPRMRQALVALHDDVGKYLHESSLLPVAGSIAAVEMANDVLAQELSAAHHEGNILLESAADHVFALTRMLVEPVPTIAPWTCLRGGLEAAALACWLLSAGIDAHDRVRRSMAFRYDGLREQAKLASANGDEGIKRHFSQSMDELEQQAARVGAPVVRDKHGRRISVGEVMPSKTDCIADVFGSEILYRLVSAVAHSQSSAVVELGFVAQDPDVLTLMKKGMAPNAAIVLLVTAAEALGRPSWAKARLFGLNTARLAVILERHFKDMQIKEARFFWCNDEDGEEA